MGIAQLIVLLIPIVIVAVVVSGVAFLIPLMRRLGQYLDVRLEERRSLGGRSSGDWDQVMSGLESLEKRMERLEERQDFTERLLERPREGEGRDESDPLAR